LYVDATLSYLMIILLNDLVIRRIFPQRFSFLYITQSCMIIILGFLLFLGFTCILGSISIDSKPLFMGSVSYAALRRAI
jgi:hypothetical protein